MKLIVGLGNPGKKYENTKHNMGFITMDYLADKYGIEINKIKFKALVGEGRIADQKAILMKPQTFMNLSGEAIREAMFFYKLDPSDLIVVYDDIDTPVGELRIRKKGSAGSHNGMKSVIYQIQSDDFPRIRLGIGQSGNIDWKNFVLSGFTKEEKPLLEEAVIKASKSIEMILMDDIDNAMNQFNYKKPKKEKIEVVSEEANVEGKSEENN